MRNARYGTTTPGSILYYGFINSIQLCETSVVFGFTRCIGIIKNDGLSSPAYSQFALHNDAVAEYYYYLMVDFTKELLHMAKNLRHSLTEEQLGAISTPVPPIQEQKQIAAYLDRKCAEIDSIIDQKREQLSILENYKKSLIYEYVTGKKEVQ